MADYRWNESDFATGYDAAAALVHPYYVEIQDVILDLLSFPNDKETLVIDAGGGSGRLVERLLERPPAASAVLLDQSEPFLELARRRLEPYGERATIRLARLQDDWSEGGQLRPHAVVSMSAIHHLDSGEKRELYRRCREMLAPGGIFINGDEVRPTDDDEYLGELTRWATRMNRLIEAEQVSPRMAELLRDWQKRNVENFAAPRASGDDCHETIEAQLGYLRDAGFRDVEVAWQKDMWAVMVGRV